MKFNFRRREGSVTRAFEIYSLIVQSLRLMVGIPDYRNYVEHRRKHHPEQPVMSYEAFFRERQAARYDVASGRFRGCC